MPEVIVAGAGPGGSAAAWALARAGADVLLLDRARFPRDKPCAEYLSPQASRILDAMGVLGAAESLGAAQLAGMLVRAPGGAVIHGEFAARHGFRGFRDRGLALRRHRLDPLLLGAAHAAGAQVEEGVRVVDVVRGAGGRAAGVRVMDERGVTREIAARLVVGADGLRSIVARRMGLARSARWPRRLAFVTHYRGVGEIGANGEMHVGRDGYLGLADVGGGETNVALVVPAARARDIAFAGPAACIERWIAARPHLAARFARAERVAAVHATGPFAARARRSADRGVALVGDAADFFDPFTGEGIYAALRGGEILAPFALDAIGAASARAADRALAGYRAARRREFGGKWIVERLIGSAVGFPPLIDHVARILSRRKDMADILIGVTGDFVPPREVLRPAYLFSLLVPAFAEPLVSRTPPRPVPPMR
ncbi:MAG TPA: FAD-dependent monooxygenase [Gemmatimonadaceae bacterium]|nr:FAD-dependent monooxygenase [Gemmatimonadaceae bacterium]